MIYWIKWLDVLS